MENENVTEYFLVWADFTDPTTFPDDFRDNDKISIKTREGEFVITYQQLKEISKNKDLLELAWGIIANAGGGDWDTQTSEWKDAAIRWRDRYHETLKESPNTIETV